MTCITIPEQPYIPLVPSRFDPVPQFAWNGGANSIAELDGSVRAAFTMGGVVGVVVGFTQDLTNVANRARITHGLFFHSTPSGQPVYQIIEAGIVRTPPVNYVPGDAFEIQRAAGAVVYLHEGATAYRSLVPLVGMVSVGSCLYATGDAIP